MEPQDIIRNLRATPSKFTYANHIKREAKKMEFSELNRLKAELRQHMDRPENASVVKLLDEIILSLSFDTAYQYN
jgi:hypothetical protein